MLLLSEQGFLDEFFQSLEAMVKSPGKSDFKKFSGLDDYIRGYSYNLNTSVKNLTYLLEMQVCATLLLLLIACLLNFRKTNFSIVSEPNYGRLPISKRRVSGWTGLGLNKK